MIGIMNTSSNRLQEQPVRVVVRLVAEQAVDDGQQLSGDDNEGLFGGFPLTDFPVVEGSQVRVVLQGRYGSHVQGLAEMFGTLTAHAGRSQRFAARLGQDREKAEIGHQVAGGGEAGDLTDLGQKNGGGLGADPRNGGQSVGRRRTVSRRRQGVSDRLVQIIEGRLEPGHLPEQGGQDLAPGGFGLAGVDRRLGGPDQGLGLIPVEIVPLERPGDLLDCPWGKGGQIGGGGVAHEHLPHDLGDSQDLRKNELQEGGGLTTVGFDVVGIGGAQADQVSKPLALVVRDITASGFS